MRAGPGQILDAMVGQAVEQALGDRITGASALSGGDINQAFAVALASGKEVFVKTNARADARMFPCEAQGLAWLAEARAVSTSVPTPVPVPAVLAVSQPDRAGPAFLVLEMLRPGRKRRDYDELLGRGLAALHRAGPHGFGLHQDNFIGTLPQDNTPCATWGAFYAEQRLLAQARLAVDGGRMPRGWMADFERLAARLMDARDDLLGPEEPPARLHGDLWGGNLHADAQGNPVIIDPAVYGGHREVDLAMLALFGGVGERMYDAYEEVYPLAPGWTGRVPLYQLYPLLVHVNLFGSSYLGAVERALRRYL